MKPFGFGAPSYAPGAVQSSALGQMPGKEDEFQKLMAMLNAQSQQHTQPRALTPMQPQTAMAQPQAAPIAAPKDRGMFGRFKDFNPLRFDPDKGVGEGNRLYAIGAMLSGMGSGDPALTANLLEPKLQQNRERVAKDEEEAKRQALLQTLSQMPGVTDQQRQLLSMGIGADQFAEQAFAPAPEPKGPIEINGQLVDPVTYKPLGDFRDKPKPIEVNGVLVDPRTYQPVADFRTPAQTGEMTTYQRGQLANEAARLGISEAELLFKMQQSEVGAGGNRKTAQDQNGVLRYIDNGEPVFPDVSKQGGGKPLIGAEAMARVAAGLPNAKGAVQDLETLTFNSKATPLSQAGYDPASDWGAAVIEAIPDWGLLKGLARWSGGEDYQMFKDSYGAFEAGMLPIISGAAITDTEAKRQMQALQIKPGDSKDTKRRKLDLMAQMVQGVELAARGDTQGFLSVLDDVGAKSGAGPVKRGGATGFEQTPDAELFYILRGE